MKKILFLLLIPVVALAQVKGVVKDSLSGQPIPYVTLWVEGEQMAATTEFDGTYELPSLSLGKTIVFSSVGYTKKRVTAEHAQTVLLSPEEYLLEEVVIAGQKNTKLLEIGIRKKSIYQAFDNGPKIETKFFPYLQAYTKTKYIKKVRLQTDCRIEDALVKLHFFAVDEKGAPGAELLKKDLLVTVKKGVMYTTVDLSDWNLVMPKNGLFVGFEKLLIERNKEEKTIVDPNSGTTRIQRKYYPFLLYAYIETPFQWTYQEGEWQKKVPSDTNDPSATLMILEPSISLILSN